MRDDIPPLEPAKMLKGGWNRDPPGPRPRIVPKPYGIPFDPDRAEKVRRDTLAAEADPDFGKYQGDPVPPIEPAKMLKGGWNRDLPPGPRPRIVPKPFGIPFDPDRAENVRRDALAAEADPHFGEYRGEPVPPLEPGKMVKGGWNRDSDIPGPRPRMVPGPMGIPFDRERTEQIRREWLARLAEERETEASAAVKPTRRGTRTRAGQHRRPLSRRPKLKPRRFFSRFIQD